MKMQGKVALIAGAATGVGYAVAELLAQEGATVFAGDLEASERPFRDGIEVISLDACRETDWERALDIVFERCGQLDVLVNVTCIESLRPLHELELFTWERTIENVQTSLLLGMREAVKVMRRQRMGSIVNVSTLEGPPGAEKSGPNWFAHEAVVGAARSMSRSAASYYVHDGIRVNAVLAALPSSPPAGGDASTPGDPLPGCRAPGGASARDVASACLFLVSGEARCVAGTEVFVGLGSALL